MCGRYTLTITWEELLIYYELEEGPSIPCHQPRYNIAPGQTAPALIHDGEKLKAGPLRWGLIPSWAKDDKMGWRTINARAETLLEKPAFRQPFQRKRCLIPADSFYEWKLAPDGKKQPLRIVPANGGLFSMAGLYDTWRNEQGEKISTFTVVTTTPNRAMEQVHDRMPVILGPEEAVIWLDRSVEEVDKLQRLLKPCPPEWLEMYAVDTKVGSVKNDSPECITAISDPPLLF
ncbi:SOS response-associated peptidase [Paenibacillus sp. ACRRX]|uniref:SOS response-associated peptidase n=1 Tax=unclassified Paenibacillus TaxID=185978 RepID=UPI001EF64093|nr:MULTISPECIES: SOS response-associated peptidase [unclassified Paenibacillus]MCG7407586.1 SOS response-associated peptidase [Paenibacillus sp. ACRRX]MDK8180821.1 SOS response-associated peptidase [Paenibacillus sp. UMB4589-SE434]